MKPILKILIICMLMLGIAISLDSSTTLAQPPRTKFDCYVSGVQIMNLEGGEATITIMGYNNDGTEEDSFYDTIPPYGSRTFAGTKNPLPVSDDFSGSVMISSNTQTAAISNILDCGGNAYASYASYYSAEENILLPLVINNNSPYNP